MRSEFDEWYEKWTGSKVKCENYDVIGAWQHRQTEVNELQKMVDAVKVLAQTLWEKSEEKHQQGKVWESKTLGECADEILDVLEQAIKGGSND